MPKMSKNDTKRKKNNELEDCLKPSSNLFFNNLGKEKGIMTKDFATETRQSSRFKHAQ